MGSEIVGASKVVTEYKGWNETAQVKNSKGKSRGFG